MLALWLCPGHGQQLKRPVPTSQRETGHGVPWNGGRLTVVRELPRNSWLPHSEGTALPWWCALPVNGETSFVPLPFSPLMPFLPCYTHTSFLYFPKQLLLLTTIRSKASERGFDNSRLAGRFVAQKKKNTHAHTHLYVCIHTYIYAYIHIHVREKAREWVCQQASHVNVCVYFLAGHMWHLIPFLHTPLILRLF